MNKESSIKNDMFDIILQRSNIRGKYLEATGKFGTLTKVYKHDVGVRRQRYMRDTKDVRKRIDKLKDMLEKIDNKTEHMILNNPKVFKKS